MVTGCLLSTETNEDENVEAVVKEKLSIEQSGADFYN